MNFITRVATVISVAALCSFNIDSKVPVKQVMDSVQEHLLAMARATPDTTQFPRSTNKDGTLFTVNSQDWTSGFFPGSLWLMYDYTGDKKWEELARSRTAALAGEQYNTGTHDLGFMLYCSFGNGYRLTHDEDYKKILIQGARSLITRFNKTAGVIKSWNSGDRWQYPVIIDNMMNLELLFWATHVTGDSLYYNIAKTHALTTLKNHFRPDNSSYHVLDYDTLTGQVLHKQTHQGYADESSWARGQAWGLYGFTVAYRETKDKRFLDQATRIADFFIHHPNLPSDKIPYWDFNDPKIPNVPRDASAAAIAASGLLELSRYAGKKGKEYTAFASRVLTSLSSPQYFASAGTNNNFNLMHSTGHLPGGSEIDTPINYADYYFIEALMRYEKLPKGG